MYYFALLKPCNPTSVWVFHCAYGGGSGGGGEEGPTAGQGRVRSARPERGGGSCTRHRGDREFHGGALPQRPERGPERAQVRGVPQVPALTRAEARGDDRGAPRRRARDAPPQAPRQARPHRLRNRRRRGHVEAAPVPAHRHHRQHLRLLPRGT